MESIPNASPFEKASAASAWIKNLLLDPPDLVMVLGSGFREVTQFWKTEQSIALRDVPHMLSPKVAGHGSELMVQKVGSRRCLVMTGRLHLYEGYSAHQQVHLLRALGLLGVKDVILTNAAGGLVPHWRAGTQVLIVDQLNLSGQSCLVGPGLEGFGKKFVDMSHAYDRDWTQRLAEKRGLETGVYASVLGPQYETPAETKMIRAMGADMVGMSTVQECLAARQLGMRVIGISLVTNLAAGLSTSVDHQEVIDAGNAATVEMKNTLEAAIQCR